MQGTDGDWGWHEDAPLIETVGGLFAGGLGVGFGAGFGFGFGAGVGVGRGDGSGLCRGKGF